MIDGSRTTGKHSAPSSSNQAGRREREQKESWWRWEVVLANVKHDQLLFQPNRRAKNERKRDRREGEGVIPLVECPA